MPKIIDCYADGKVVETYRNLYSRVKFGKPKHNYYVRNRRSAEIKLDAYDEYIITHLKPGRTITYDCAGYYLDGVVPDLTVIELQPIMQSWYPAAIIDTGQESVEHLYSTADNFIIVNTIQIRWRTFNYITSYWANQRRFLKPGAQVFYSFRSIYILHNKLKYHFSDLLQAWLNRMEQYGYRVVNYSHDLIPVNDTITNIEKVPEIDDLINGNVKVHWEYNPL